MKRLLLVLGPLLKALPGLVDVNPDFGVVGVCHHLHLVEGKSDPAIAHAEEAADIDDRLFDLAVRRQDQLFEIANVLVVGVVDRDALGILGGELVIVSVGEAVALNRRARRGCGSRGRRVATSEVWSICRSYSGAALRASAELVIAAKRASSSPRRK